MLIMNAEGIVQKETMAAKINCIIATLKGFFLPVLFSEIRQINGISNSVPNNDHNTIYTGQRMIPTQIRFLDT